MNAAGPYQLKFDLEFEGGNPFLEFDPASPFSASSTGSDSDYEVQEDLPDDFGEDEALYQEFVLKGTKTSVLPKKTKTSKAKPGNQKLKAGLRCHYCRQAKPVDHVSCSRCTVNYCGQCLRNRNGEDIRVQMSSSVRWVCPRCRGGCGPGCRTCCTCVPCRNSKGLMPTQQIVRVARSAGYDNVHDYLISLETGEAPQVIASRKVGRGWTKDEDDANRAWASKRVRRQTSHRLGHSKWTDHALLKGGIEGGKENCRPVNATIEDLFTSSIDICETDYDSKNSRCQQFDCTDARSEYENQRSHTVDQEREQPQQGNNADEDKKGSVLCDWGEELPPEAVCDWGEELPPDHQSPRSGMQQQNNGNGGDSSCRLLAVPSTSDEPTTVNTPHTSLLDCGRPSGTQSNEFRRGLGLLWGRPFSWQQLHRMYEHIVSSRPVMRLGQQQIGHPEEHLSKETPTYLDLYPDLASKLAKAIPKDERLKLLRGFFFWVQHADMEGSYRPWVTAQSDDEQVEEHLDISDPDSQAINELLAVDISCCGLRCYLQGNDAPKLDFR